MKIIKIVGLLLLVVGIVFALIKKDSITKVFQNNTEHTHINKMVGDKDEKETVKPFYQGEVVNVEQGGGYTFIEIKEKTEITFWIVVEKADVKVGDYVQFQKELVAHNFESKSLNKTFEELMFATNLQYKVSE